MWGVLGNDSVTTFPIFPQNVSGYHSFFIYIFIDYAITVVQFFPLCIPPPSILHSLRQSPHPCSCPWVMCVSSLATPFPILYITCPWLFCNYLFVLLNPLTSSPIPPHPLLSGNHQNSLHVRDSVSVLLVCLVCFLDSR